MSKPRKEEVIQDDSIMAAAHKGIKSLVDYVKKNPMTEDRMTFLSKYMQIAPSKQLDDAMKDHMDSLVRRINLDHKAPGLDTRLADYLLNTDSRFLVKMYSKLKKVELKAHFMETYLAAMAPEDHFPFPKQLATLPDINKQIEIYKKLNNPSRSAYSYHKSNNRALTQDDILFSIAFAEQTGIRTVFTSHSAFRDALVSLNDVSELQWKKFFSNFDVSSVYILFMQNPVNFEQQDKMLSQNPQCKDQPKPKVSGLELMAFYLNERRADLMNEVEQFTWKLDGLQKFCKLNGFDEYAESFTNELQLKLNVKDINHARSIAKPHKM